MPGGIVGCIGLIKLGREGWFEIRNLALKDPSLVRVSRELLGKTLEYLETENPQYLKAFTPAVQPYVDFYKQAGFEPLRRYV